MKVQCPQCGTFFVNRARCEGVWEIIQSFLTAYPFRCQLCTNRFLAFRGRPTYGSKREYRRMPVCCPVVFEARASSMYQPLQGKGLVLDLSIRGCAFNSEVPLHGGVRLSLRLMPRDSETIEINHAVVRHLRGNRVGVEFLDMTTRNQEELRKIVEARLVQQSSPVAWN